MFRRFSMVLAATALGAGSPATAEACGCSCSCSTAPAQAAAPAPATAQAPSGERTYRRYSYEPSTRTYAAPRMRESRTPLYALPKTDSRKFGGR